MEACMFNFGNNSLTSQVSARRGLMFGLIIVMALLSFEMFNFGTTEYALADLVGELRFLEIPWATILAIAFCGIDFAGIARLFTPNGRSEESVEVWYLFGAWLLAATMNALLTWWGVSLALLNHPTLGNIVVDQGTLLKVVPIFIAVMVWLIRVLIIGTFSLAGDKLFTQADVSDRPVRRSPARRRLPEYEPDSYARIPTQLREAPVGFNPAPKPGLMNREPTYRPVSMAGRRID
jgi:hypothetical protein